MKVHVKIIRTIRRPRWFGPVVAHSVLNLDWEVSFSETLCIQDSIEERISREYPGYVLNTFRRN